MKKEGHTNVGNKRPQPPDGRNSQIRYLAVLTLICFAAFIVPITYAKPKSAQAKEYEIKEYEIKAAFMYNFLKFVDWPEEKVADSNNTITIGVIGKAPFGNAFEPIKDKRAKGRKVAIKWFEGFEELEKSDKKDKPELHRKVEELRKCHLLFICSSENKNLEKIIEALKNACVLTVGETAGFLEAGGIINFVIEEKKIGFEINLAAARQDKLKFRSKLLRLAKRVVSETDAGANIGNTGRQLCLLHEIKQ